MPQGMYIYLRQIIRLHYPLKNIPLLGGTASFMDNLKSIIYSTHLARIPDFSNMLIPKCAPLPLPNHPWH